ncbi:MAG: alpha/beta hydrolase [Actinomycetia bacterium]|nr:alpha/beta hydrolase [Actinomycetes bacterium]MCP4959299.1 alpha/beta hydrolase [Actinomycetes bacterium]
MTDQTLTAGWTTGADQLPPMPHPLVEAFGRPTWKERRRFAEAAELSNDPVELAPGDGRSVVVAPGFGGSAESVGDLVGWFDGAGYSVRVADLEGNRRASAWAVERIIATLDEIGRPSILIGHSRGGQQCRVAAHCRPDLIDRLITLGAPVRAHVPRHFVLRAAAEVLRAQALLRGVDLAEERRYEAVLTSPFEAAVDWTSIWSRSDGLVAWQACFSPAAENVEVECSHRGLVASVASFEAISESLIHPHIGR